MHDRMEKSQSIFNRKQFIMVCALAGLLLLGGVLILVMVVPIFTIVSPLLVMLMAFCDYLLLLTTSWYAVNAVRLLWSRGRISLFGALCCTLCLCCFVLDFFAAWYLRRTVCSCPE